MITDVVGRSAAALICAAWIAAVSLCASAAEPAAEGPPKPAGQTVLVLPTRVPIAEAASRATLDLLIVTALEELGFAVTDAGQAAKRLDASAPDLGEARELHLGLHLRESFEAARAVREAHLAHRGDLLAEPALAEVELLMMRTLLDLGERDAAFELALLMLEREPGLRLDPVEHPPAMQAVWLSALEKRAAWQPREHAPEAVAALGKAIGTRWVVAAIAKRTADGAEWLVLQIVPTGGDEKPSRHPMVLGERGTWAKGLRLKLEERFPPPPPEIAGPSVPTPPEQPPEDGKKIWYKSWWFWGAVGLVVVGSAVAGIAAAVDDGSSGGEVNGKF